jgi:chromate transporter
MARMAVEPEGTEIPTPRVSLSTLFWTFFKIACTSFGGFMAMISAVEREVVARRGLMRHEDMLDGISLASILPGPVAVNLVVYVGYRLRGGAGALVSALGAVLPSFAFIVLLSVAYFQWGQVPAVNKLFMGFIPAVTALIVSAAWNMSRKAVTGWREGVLSVASAGALLGIGGFYSTLGIILIAGVAGWWWFRAATAPAVSAAAAPSQPLQHGARASLLLVQPWSLAVPFLTMDPGLMLKLFLVFASMSVMLFGGGYVFIPLIQEIVVDGHGWVTTQEFIDAIAMGQITPGPILVSAAFIGLKVAGFTGAVVATVGIYLPPALLMVASTRALEFIKKSQVIRAALRGIRPAVVGMIAAAAITVGATAPHHWVSLLIFVSALIALMRLRVQVAWVIPAAGLAGLLLF